MDSNIRYRRLLVLSVLTGLPVIAQGVVAATIRVPADEPTIQAGIDAVAENDTVLVAPGTYTGAGNVNLDFGGKDLVLRSEGGDNVTIIDCQGGPGNEVRGFIFESGESAAAVVAGFTVRNGYLESAGRPDGAGAGILIYGAGTAPTIDGCTFESNEAQYGGGLTAGNGATPDVRNCQFRRNRAHTGGGVDAASAATFTACSFVDNEAVAGGGGFSTDGQFTGCSFAGNSATNGAGIACSEGLTTVTQSSVETNRSDPGRGAAVHCISGGRVDFVDCVLNNNVTVLPTGALVGVADADGGALSFSNCTLVANEVSDFNSFPSAMVYVRNMASAEIENTIIAFGIGGAAVVCDATSSATVSCTDIFGNEEGDWVECVEGMQAMNGNVAADPLFCERATGNLQLAENSPCAPANSGACGLIGALPVGCPPSAIEPSTWGAVKAGFRR